MRLITTPEPGPDDIGMHAGRRGELGGDELFSVASFEGWMAMRRCASAPPARPSVATNAAARFPSETPHYECC
jgi:hypothetical protein